MSASQAAPLPPQNLEAEQQLLGAALYDNGCVESVAALIQPHHFHQPLHGRIWEAIVHVVRDGGTADPVVLKTHFEHDEAMKEVGGPGYLMDLAARAVNSVRGEQYARILVDLYARRQIIKASRETIERAHSGDLVDTATSQLGSVIGWAQQVMYELPASGMQETAGYAAGEVVRNLVSGQYEHGLPWGLRDLTAKTGGLLPTDLIVIGARPSMGKSAFGLMVAKAVAYAAREDAMRETIDKKGGALFVSFEMTTRMLVMRQIADAAFDRMDPIHYSALRQGRMEERWKPRLDTAVKRLEALPLIIDDGASATVEGVEAAARAADKTLQERGSKLGVLIVDYLGLMRAKRDRNTNRQQEIGLITGGLKSIAKRMRIPVVALHQVGRGVEQRDDKRPTMADLRESGDIEQDADVIIFLYRDHYYLARQRPKDPNKEEDWAIQVASCAHELEVILAKQRNGPTGTVRAWCDLACNRIQSDDPINQQQPGML